MTLHFGKTIIVLAVVLAATPVEAQTTKELTDAVYRRYFGRNADPGAVEIWARSIREGIDPLELEAGFLSTVEYYDRAGGTNHAFIRAVFRDLVGPASSRQDVNGWVRFLEDRGGDAAARAEVALELLKQTGAGVIQTHLGRDRDRRLRHGERIEGRWERPLRPYYPD
jgi:hypothetical protein